MTQPQPTDTGYGIIIAPPADQSDELRTWTEATLGATWDTSGAHITVLRLTGTVPATEVEAAMHEVCAGLAPFPVRLGAVVREPYWDKPGLEIVMLAGEQESDTRGIFALRGALVGPLTGIGLRVHEGGVFRPHLTLTTGLPPDEARALELAAASLDLTFDVSHVTLWSGGERLAPDDVPEPPWQRVATVPLSGAR